MKKTIGIALVILSVLGLIPALSPFIKGLNGLLNSGDESLYKFGYLLGQLVFVGFFVVLMLIGIRLTNSKKKVE